MAPGRQREESRASIKTQSTFTDNNGSENSGRLRTCRRRSDVCILLSLKFVRTELGVKLAFNSVAVT